MKLIPFPAPNQAPVVLRLRSASLHGQALDILRRELRALATPGRRLLLDLSAVQSLSSSAAQLIIQAANRLHLSGGSLKLTGVTPSAAAFLELFRVPRSVEIETSLPLAA